MQRCALGFASSGPLIGGGGEGSREKQFPRLFPPSMARSIALLGTSETVSTANIIAISGPRSHIMSHEILRVCMSGAGGIARHTNPQVSTHLMGRCGALPTRLPTPEHGYRNLTTRLPELDTAVGASNADLYAKAVSRRGSATPQMADQLAG